MKRLPIIIAWLLLLVPALFLGGAAWRLLKHEGVRLANAKTETARYRAEAIAENIDLLVIEVKDGLGQALTVAELYRKVAETIRRDRVHNINLVTPDHFFPHARHLVSLCRQNGFDLPIVWNLSGYQSVTMLRAAEKN